MKKLIITQVFLLIAFSSYSQESSNRNGLTLQLGTKGHRYYTKKLTRDHFGLNLNYRFSNHFELGGYLSYLHVKDDFTDSEIKNGYSLFYGINGYYHLSPYFVKQDPLKLQVYLKGSLGGYRVLYTELGDPARYNYLDWGGYLGVAYYPWKRVGFYGEVGYGTRSLGEFGISIKLSK